MCINHKVYKTKSIQNFFFFKMTQMHSKEGETGAYNNRNKFLLPFTEFFLRRAPFFKFPQRLSHMG